MEPFYYPLLNRKGMALGLAHNSPIMDYLEPTDAAYLKG